MPYTLAALANELVCGMADGQLLHRISATDDAPELELLAAEVAACARREPERHG